MLGFPSLGAASAPSSPPDRYAGLLQYLESLYAFAQTLTPNATSAAHLVEATYRRALAALRNAPPGVETKAWLFRLMMQAFTEQAPSTLADPGSVWPETPPDAGMDRSAPDAFRRRLAEQFLDQALPAALVTLSEAQRRLLVLCEVEQFSCTEAGSVLGLDALAACEQLERARHELTAVLRENASAAEHHLVMTSLPANWIGQALQRTLEAELSPVPPTLRPTLTAVQADRHAVEAPASSPVRPGLVRRWLPNQFFQRMLTPLLIVFVTGLLGYVLSQLFEEGANVNLIALSVDQADAVRPTFKTDDPARAERFVQDHMNRRLTLPIINAAALSGVALREVADGVSVPVFLYRDSLTDASITLYAYNYALLDQYPDRIRLEPDILRLIEDDRHFDLHDLGEEKALIWRNRDEIYLAVTRGDAAALRERIFFPA